MSHERGPELAADARVPRSVRVLCAALIVVTATTFWVGSGHPGAVGVAGASATLVVVGFAKAWAIGWWFMEVGSAPRVLRGLLTVWAAGFAIACAVLVLR